MGAVSLQPAGKAASCVTVIVWLGDREAAVQLCPRLPQQEPSGPGPAQPSLSAIPV